MDAGEVAVTALRLLRTVTVALDGDDARTIDDKIAAAVGALVPTLADGCEVTRGEAIDGDAPRREVRCGDIDVEGAEDSTALVLPVVAGTRALGELRLVRAASRPPWSEAERLVAEEVAARLGAAVEAERLRAEADEAARLQDEFLATLSHELRTPLHVMVGWIDLLRAGLPPERQHRAIEVLERNARVQTRLIQDLLDASGILSGRLLLELEDVAIADVVLAAVEAVKPQAESLQIVLRARIDDSPHIRADGERLGQVLHNLLGNALKFTPAGGKVEVTVDADADSVTVAVRDTGSGISAELLPAVFDRFFQGTSSPNGPRRGLGLGLYIVRHLVRLHGGTITAESDGPGRGACFTAVLPRRGPE